MDTVVHPVPTPPGCTLGIDVGGTTIAGVAVTTDPDGTPHTIASREVSAPHGARPLVRAITGLCDALAGDVAGTAEARAIGIGTPGTVSDDGDVRDIANLGVAHVALRAEVERRTGLPVRVENDVN
ncbi:MAG: ROK family protein, partial [Bifidobacterium sp.]|nr:ROK family protein [Bifidobacterium sp.]